jgi:hypothetical protein
MTGNQKLALIGLAVFIVIGSGAYWGFQYLHRYPGKDEVSRFISTQLTGPGQKVLDVSSKPVAAGASTSGSRQIKITINSGTPAGSSALGGFNAIAPRPGVIQMDFVATMESTEALYERISTDQYIKQHGADPAVFQKIQWILNGPNAAKVRQLAGIAGPVEDFNGKTLVREKTPKGHHYTSSGVINALRQGGKWQMAIVSGPQPDKDTPLGYRLSYFSGQVYSLGQADQAKKINDLISHAAKTLQSLQQAQEQYHADSLAAQEAARQQRSPGTRPMRFSDANQKTSPVTRNNSFLNIVTIPRGTVFEVTTQEAVDTSNLHGFYGAETGADIPLPGEDGVSRGSPARFVVAKVGNAFQMRLSSLVVNGLWVPVNTEWISLGPITQEVSIANQKLVIDAGKSFKFHQL